MSLIIKSFSGCFTKINFLKNQVRLKTMSSLLVPPTSVRGNTELNRESFTTKINVPCLLLQTDSVSKIMPILKKYILKLPKFKPIQKHDSGDTIVYLDPNKVKDFSNILEKERQSLLERGKYIPNCELNLSYDNFTANVILKAIMPEGMEVPTSFSIIGHIIHLNLQSFQLPFAKVIGQVYLDKIPNVTTVVNKMSNIDNTYRFFAMEVIAGDNNTVVTVKENKCTYTFDFAKVYWNPRLSTEHQILTDMVKSEDVMYDVFAGVGPFAIPAARKGSTVLANDLNSESFKWLQHNAKINKIKNNLECFNLDGREFLKSIVKTHLLKRRNSNLTGCEHIVMNLPASAIDFIEVFDVWLSDEEKDLVYSKPIYVHLYCFVKLQENEEAVTKAKHLVEEKLGYSLDGDSLKNIHYVRNVAPNKEMMRVSFLLIKDVMENGEPRRKKLKSDNHGVDNGILGENGSQTGTTKIEQECFQAERSSNNEGQENTEDQHQTEKVGP